jgi:hypothetical protein
MLPGPEAMVDVKLSDLAGMDPSAMAQALSTLPPDLLLTLASVSAEVAAGAEQDEEMDEADPRSVID